MMKNQKLFHILVRVQYGHKKPEVAHDEILSLLDGSELGVLDAPAQSHGDLLAVGESHASGADQSEDSEQTSAGTLGKITDDGRICPICKGEKWYETNGGRTMSPCPSESCWTNAESS